MEHQENFPLRWPEGWPRTRLQDRKNNQAWKWTYPQAVDRLLRELKRFKATAVLITRNETRMEDSGVAVYFSLKPLDAYGWQEALGFVGEVPTIAQIDKAYRDRAVKVHPDGPTPDIALFNALTKHRDDARAWARGEQKIEHDKCIAIDTFKEQRWNVNAIRLTVFALRQIERCGSAVVMERAFKGFAKQITAAASGGERDKQTVA
jgi:hypothetical protein